MRSSRPCGIKKEVSRWNKCVSAAVPCDSLGLNLVTHKVSSRPALHG